MYTLHGYTSFGLSEVLHRTEKEEEREGEREEREGGERERGRRELERERREGEPSSSASSGS